MTQTNPIDQPSVKLRLRPARGLRMGGLSLPGRDCSRLGLWFIHDALSGFRVLGRFRPHKASSGIDKVGGKARVEAPDYRNRISDLVLPAKRERG
jgi:hypothetical protein